VVAGALAMRPGYGGHAWVFLNWLLGLRSLGFDVLFVDRLDRPEPTHLAWLAAVMNGPAIAWGLSTAAGSTGVDAEEMSTRVAEADVVIDVMGHAEPALLARARTSVFLDIDPGFGQLWEQLGQAQMFGRHHHYATVGLNTGRAECRIPTRGIEWVPTLPPVAIAEWPAQNTSGRRVTSVLSWRGPFDPIEFEGEVLGLRVHQFRRYLGVPAHSGEHIELALDIDPADAGDAAALHRSGYEMVDPRSVAGTPDAYRAYVQDSAAELCVAKDLYVRSRGGWFSDRSACYLASGRPVAHHDTALRAHLPIGDGLLVFDDEDGAAAALRSIREHPEHHKVAARQFAEEHLDARVVIAELLDRVGVA
jgi:hypothetical protein